MGDLTLQVVMLRIAAALVVISVHGAAVAAIACLMGDPGPRHDGRLSLSPLRHLDLIGGLLLVVFAFGWIAPIAVDPNRLRGGRGGLLAVAAGGTGATFALSVLLRLVRPFVLNSLPDTAAASFFVFVETAGQLCFSFTLFNLLPVPPLTGQHLLVAIMPRQRKALRHAQPYCMALLALLVATGLVARLLTPIAVAIQSVTLID